MKDFDRMAQLFFTLIVCLAVQAGWAQTSSETLWKDVAIDKAARPAEQIWIEPLKGRTCQLDRPGLEVLLEDLSASAKSSQAMTMDIPLPGGETVAFALEPVSVMAPELAAKFPEIKTFTGTATDGSGMTGRFDLTPKGFHGMVFSAQGAIYIDPLYRDDDTIYTSYFARDADAKGRQHGCLVEGSSEAIDKVAASPNKAVGTQLRTFRLAQAATGEYTQFHGGTLGDGISAVATTINRVSFVYERELAVRLVLVAGNDNLIYTDSATDPYSNDNAYALLGENQSNIDGVIGSANYDIGHVFGTGGGGLAALGVVCENGFKAQGETGSPAPVGDPFDIDYVCHEMGHQFGADHTFNGIDGNCAGGNRNASTAYEPGSGSTIMAYAGICWTDDLQPNSDPYFHSASFDQITNYINSSGGCAVVTATGNQLPTVEAGPNYTIPIGTAFILTASGVDLNGDNLTYCWEQRDLGAAQAVDAIDNGSSPIFRAWPATEATTRSLPRLEDVIDGTLATGEQYPSKNRTLDFRVTVRDNRLNGGGVDSDTMAVTVTTSAGPFEIVNPGAGITWYGGEPASVWWTVAGTDANGINTASVRVTLSLDGGASFPYVLAASTPNDGELAITVPDGIDSENARVKIEAIGNIYYDISNVDFVVSDGPPPNASNRWTLY